MSALSPIKVVWTNLFFGRWRYPEGSSFLVVTLGFDQSLHVYFILFTHLHFHVLYFFQSFEQLHYSCIISR